MSSNTVINTNVLALTAHRALSNLGTEQRKTSQRLSTGLRINTAADDAAGLAISEKMRAQIRGLDQASRNAQDGISLVQTAEGGLAEVNNMIQRIRELTVQAANDTNQAEDRDKLQNEIDQLVDEIRSMGDKIEFNANKLFSFPAAGAASSQSFYFQVGANSGQLTTAVITLDLARLASQIGSIFAVGLGNMSGAVSISSLINVVGSFLDDVTTQRAELGAVQNRLEYTISALLITSENLSASESRIRDADMAQEMMNLSKNNVLQQAAIAMLAQANQSPQNILQLLR